MAFTEDPHSDSLYSILFKSLSREVPHRGAFFETSFKLVLTEDPHRDALCYVLVNHF